MLARMFFAQGPVFSACGPALLRVRKKLRPWHSPQMDPIPAFRAEILHRQGIGYLIRIESSSLIRNDNEDFPAGFATAMNMNQLASLQAIAMEHRVAQCFPQSELEELLIAADTMRRCDQVHKPVDQR